MATPHHLDDRLTWEDVLWEMIKATKTSHYGRLSHVLSRLVDSVSQLSHVFYSFATKYPMTNFVEGKGFSNYGPVREYILWHKALL